MNTLFKWLRSSFFWTKILPASWVVGVATLGFGRHVKAPGTWGSVVGLLFYTVFFAPRASTVVFCLVLGAVALYVAAAFCDEAELRMGETDPGAVILDEVAAMPLVFIGLPLWEGRTSLPFWALMLVGFALFRLFDILKPFGIARLQKWPGGIGIVADDVAAALASCVTLHVILIALFYYQRQSGGV